MKNELATAEFDAFKATFLLVGVGEPKISGTEMRYRLSDNRIHNSILCETIKYGVLTFKMFLKVRLEFKKKRFLFWRYKRIYLVVEYDCVSRLMKQNREIMAGLNSLK
jgi:hypothetical protein